LSNFNKLLKLKHKGGFIMNKKKWLVVSMVVFLSVFALFGCLPSTNGEPEEKLHIKVILPETTPEDVTEIYLIGSYCDWNFDEARTSEVKTEDGQKYAEFELQITEFPLEYKYTYGASWDYEELDENGRGLDGNRRIDVKPDKDIQDVVLNWKGKDKIDYTDLQEEITVTFVVNVPEGTEDDEGKIYMRGLNGDWDTGYQLNKTGETYTLSETTTSYTVQKYKFLRNNDWDYVEKDESGEDIGNRVTILTGDSTIVSVVEGWAQ